MTYCLGVKVGSGFVGIADTRITSGNETTKAKKVFTVNSGKSLIFHHDIWSAIGAGQGDHLLQREH